MEPTSVIDKSEGRDAVFKRLVMENFDEVAQSERFFRLFAVGVCFFLATMIFFTPTLLSKGLSIDTGIWGWISPAVAVLLAGVMFRLTVTIELSQRGLRENMIQAIDAVLLKRGERPD